MIREIRDILLYGIRAVFYNSKIVLLLWFFNAASALVLSVPILNILLDNLGTSLMSDKLAVSFDLMWYIQLRDLYKIQFEQLPLSIYSVVGIYTILQTFFLGGLVAIFSAPEKNHIVDFFYGGVRYFSRFFKVMLISILLFALAFNLNGLMGQLITYFFAESENAMADFIFKFIRYVLMVFFIGVITLISDYSKVSLAVRDKTKILKEIYYAMIFIKNNFAKVFTVFLIVAILGAAGAIIYNLLGRFIPRTPYYFMILTFILQQMLIIFRLLIRMLFCATEVNIFKDLSADIVNIEQSQ